MISEGTFRDLKVWHKAKSLAVAIYTMTQDGNVAKDFARRDQLRRSALSICSNIAEGDERETITRGRK